MVIPGRRGRSAGRWPPILLVLATSVVGAAACRPPDDTEATGRGVPRYTIEQFLATTTVRGASFSPDGSKLLISSNESGIFNAYALPVDGGPPERLTDSEDDAVFVVGYFPQDERFLYLQDDGGNELSHLYVRQEDGSVADLTPGDGLKANFLGWAADDRSFFVATNERDARFFDIYEIGVDDYARALLYRDDTGYEFADIGPGKRHIAFSKPTTTSDSDVFLYDRETGEMRKLTPHEGEVANRPLAFSPDGSALYYTTDAGGEFSRLVRWEVATGEVSTVLEPGWDVSFASFSKNGKYLIVGINEEARTRVRVFEMPGMEPVGLPDLSGLDLTSASFSRDEKRLAFYASSGRSPRNLFVMAFPDGEPRRLTRALNPDIDPNDLVEPEIVRFASYDGLEIPGLLYRPHAAGVETPVPALVWVHGGPGGQSRVGYSPLIQYLVNHGYAVYAINNRGSSGYGKTFFRLDDLKHGEADLDDCVASKAMLVGTGWVQPDRIGIIGGSYGGYMVLAALAFRPDDFAVGVDLFGISNWVRTIESIPPWWESFRLALYREIGNPDSGRDALIAKSPLFHADRIQRPLMVLQGANDPRVLKVESDEIVEAARANGVPVEYLLFEDEGHGFVKRENQEEGYRKILGFLNRYLKEGEPPETAG
ncbi:MAG: alpha/beta fold hydrolase [Gemmatimonadota bacterium]